MTDSSLYETDIVAWADRQVEELRRLAEAGITDSLANVIEEIESVGRSERHAVTWKQRRTRSSGFHPDCHPAVRSRG